MANQGYRYRHQVNRCDVSCHLLDYFVERFCHSTAQQWMERFAAGEIEINGIVASGQEHLHLGDQLVWNRPGWEEPAVPQNIKIIYQDDDILAVDKPSGLPTLPGSGFYENTLLHQIRSTLPSARPLHRLGRGTSGLVLFALTKTSTRKLNDQWPTINKHYRALSTGAAQQDHYEIQTPIGPVDHPKLGTVHAASSIGKTALSIARLLQRHDRTTLFEVDLLTGRPHQIRIHLASINHPLVGDPLYTNGGIPLPTGAGLPGDLGYHLHAHRLTFRHPVTEQTVQLTAPCPRPLCAGFDDDSLAR